MDASLIKLFSSQDKLSEVENDAIIVYLVLRADIAGNETGTTRLLKAKGELTSGLDVQTIARRAGLSFVTTRRLLEDLARRSWIKTRYMTRDDAVYQLGIKSEFDCAWFIDEESKKEVKEEVLSESVARIREVLQERAARKAARTSTTTKLPLEAKRRMAEEVLGPLAREEKASTRVLRHYNEAFQKTFMERPSSTEGSFGKPSAKSYVMVRRLLEWCEDDVDRITSLIDWVLKNWDQIKPVAHLDGKPGINIFCTKSLFERFDKWKKEGIPKPKPTDIDGVGKRADSKIIEDSPDYGWGD